MKPEWQKNRERNQKDWERMQFSKECADKALNEYYDENGISWTTTPYDTSVLVDLLIGLRHLCDLKEGMDFELAYRASMSEYEREKNKYSYPGYPACADKNIVTHQGGN